MPRNQTWSNQDGLVVGFGTHTEDNNVSGVDAQSGGRVVLRQTITGVDLSDTYAATDFNPQDVIIPRGSRIIRASFQVLTAFTSGGAATLDIGTFTKGLATDVVDDADGLVADMSIAELTSIGEVHILDGALIGASGQTAVGATGLGDVVIAPSYETAVYTAGTGILTVEYQVPSDSAGRTIAAV